MRVIILNLTRFGDLLQSQAVIHQLHKQGHDVGLVCLQNFAPAASLLDGVSYVAPLPGGSFLAGLDDSWPAALASVHTWLETVRNEFAPDDILNLTASPSARLLARLLTHILPIPKDPRGFSMDDHGFGLSGTAWTAFFEASTRRRGCSPYNIVDVFLRASGLLGPAHYALCSPGKPEQHAMKTRLAELARNAGANPAGYVAMQLGASEAQRQWPVDSFAHLGRSIFSTFNFMPVLLGAEHEKPLAEAYLSTGAPGISVTGETSLTKLAATLTLTRLLITNDTGTMHLAAGLGIRCLAFFLATAQPWDTGPYLEDCCSLESALDCHPCGFGTQCPHKHRCLTHIQPEAVWPLVQGMLREGTWACPPELAAQARVWRSQRDESGTMDLISLSGHENDDRTRWTRLQRFMYRHFLDKMDEVTPATNPHDDLQNLKPIASGLSETFRDQALGTLRQADTLLHLFQEQGRLTITRPTPRGGQQFLATCQRIETLFDRSESFNALGRLWQSLSQEKGTHLPALLACGAELRACLAAWRTLLQ